MRSLALTACDGLAMLGGAILLLLAANHVRLLVAAWPARAWLLKAPPPCLGAMAEPPQVLVQIPVFNEARSVVGALETAVALDWPRDRLTIQLLDDSDDETTRLAAAAISRLAAGGTRIEHVRRGERAGYKAGALALGLARCDAPYVAMLDADFRAPRDWLRRGIGMLEADARAGFAQFRFEVRNRRQSLPTRVQGLLVDTHFLVEQTGRAALFEPLQFNGTAGIWRRRALEEAGGWHADTLAEDLDLSLRAQAGGWRGAIALQPCLACEAPASIRDWRGQQRRWSEGFVQVAAKQLSLRTPKGRRREAIPILLLMGLQLAFPALIALSAGFLADGAIRGFGAAHALLAATAAALGATFLVALTWPPYRDLRRGSAMAYAGDLAALPLLMIMLALANSAAIVAAPFARQPVFVRTPKAGPAESSSEERG